MIRETSQRIIVIGIILLCSLTGCGNQHIQEEKDKPESISFMTNVGIKPNQGFADWIHAYSSKTGINLNFTYTDTNEYYSNLEVRFESGNVPDVFTVGGDRLSTYASDGRLYDMTELVNSSQYIQTIDEDVLKSITLNGRIYGIPLERGGGTVTYIRKDWLDKVNLSVPTSYEEFIEVLRAFKGLGENIIPFTAAGFVSEQAEYYLGQFYQDATPELVYVKGKWVDGISQPNMILALQRIKEAYKEELIDPETITNKTSTCRDKWYAGNVGVFDYWAGNWATSLEKRLKDNVSTAEVVTAKPLKEYQYIERIPSVMSISSECKEPESVFKYFIEYAADRQEGSLLFQHGVEGIHYYLDEGKVTAMKKNPDKEEVFEKAFISPILTTTSIQLPSYKFEIDGSTQNSLDIFYSNCKEDYILPKSAKLTEIREELIQLKEQTIVAIITGELEIEEGLEQYRIKAEALGIKNVLEELNTIK